MKPIKRYGLSTRGDLGKDSDTPVRNHGVGVPTKYLETKGRKRFAVIMDKVGFVCFCLTTLAVAYFIVGTCVSFFLESTTIVITESESFIESITIIRIEDLIMGSLFIFFGLIHLGFFMELAVANTGKVWFAKSVGLIWGCLLSIFAIGAVVKLVTAVFM